MDIPIRPNETSPSRHAWWLSSSGHRKICFLPTRIESDLRTCVRTYHIRLFLLTSPASPPDKPDRLENLEWAGALRSDAYLNTAELWTRNASRTW